MHVFPPTACDKDDVGERRSEAAVGMKLAMVPAQSSRGGQRKYPDASSTSASSR